MWKPWSPTTKFEDLQHLLPTVKEGDAAVEDGVRPEQEMDTGGPGLLQHRGVPGVPPGDREGGVGVRWGWRGV